MSVKECASADCMTAVPSRAVWIARRAAMAVQFMDVFGVGRDEALAQAHEAMVAAVGPCPPEPAPEWHTSSFYGFGGGATQVHVRCTEDSVTLKSQTVNLGLNPDDAEGMGHALIRAATYVREQQIAKESR